MIVYLAKLIKHLKYLRNFRTSKGLGGFSGVYDNFEQAENEAKKLGRTNYNHKVVADWYDDNFANQKMEIKDYPILYWLRSITCENDLVFDVGGNLGKHFFLFKNIDPLFQNTKWMVFDLPEFTKKGKSINDDPNLSFTDNIDDLKSEFIIIANGSLQYFDDQNLFYDSLHKKGNEHVIISSIPLHQDIEFVTVQNGGITYYPSVVLKYSDFLNKMNSIGYEVIDQWEDPISNCFIPFHPKASQAKYFGFYFRKK